MRACILVLVAAMLVGSLLVTEQTLSGQQGQVVVAIPTKAFVAAALEHQGQLGEGTLELRGTHRRLDRTQPMFTFHYVRTPTMIYREQVWSRHKVAASLDRLSLEYRTLTTPKAKGRWTAYIGQGPGAAAPFLDQSVPDMGEYPIVGTWRIVDAVRQGTIAPATEQIDGQTCLRIDVDPVADVKACALWLDPALGFCPRRLDIAFADGSSKNISFADYSDVGDGVWIPAKTTLSLTCVGEPAPGSNDPNPMLFVTEVKEAKAGGAYSRKDLEVVVSSSGTTTDDEEGSYSVGPGEDAQDEE